MRSALEPSRQLADLLGVVMTSVAHAVRIAVEKNIQRSVTVDLHRPVLGQRGEVAFLVVKEVGLDNQGNTSGEHSPRQLEDEIERCTT